jgi:hypothetical protein
MAAGGTAHLAFSSQAPAMVGATVYAGVTGASLQSWQWAVPKASVADSLVISDGATAAMVGQRGVFTVDARDECGHARWRGGEWQQHTLRVKRRGGTSAVSSVDATLVKDHGDGRYAFEFTPQEEGTYDVLGVGGTLRVERFNRAANMLYKPP